MEKIETVIIPTKRVFFNEESGFSVYGVTVKPEDEKKYLSQLETIKNIGRYIGCENYAGTVAIQASNAKKAKDDLIKMKQELIAGKGE